MSPESFSLVSITRLFMSHNTHNIYILFLSSVFLLSAPYLAEGGAVRIKSARTNSRFLRTFPPLELIKLARRQGSNGGGSGMINPNSILDTSPSFGGSPLGSNSHSSSMTIRPRLENGNSPVFYIRLPPAPYVFVPNYGWISPHPYSNPQLMGLATSPVMLGGLGGSPQMDSLEEQKNVISLPLKFLSNGRPAQIDSPAKIHHRRKKPMLPSKPMYRPMGSFGSNMNEFDSSESNKANLISGGHYSFNGKPTAIFVVRSPAEEQEPMSNSSSMEK